MAERRPSAAAAAAAVPTITRPFAGQGPPQKPRFTRAEKRNYARERAAQGFKARPPQPAGASKVSAVVASGRLSKRELELYVLLFEAKGRLVVGVPEAKTMLHVLEEKAGVLGGTATLAPLKQAQVQALEALPKKEKELSAKKLEKIEKRRQVRAERKAALIAKKAAETPGNDALEAAGYAVAVPVPVPSATKSPVRSATKSPVRSATKISARRSSSGGAKSPAPVSARRASIASRSPARSRPASAAKPELVHPDDDFELGY